MGKIGSGQISLLEAETIFLIIFGMESKHIVRLCLGIEIIL